MMQWKSGQEFVRPVYTPLSGPNVRLLEQADRVSNTTPEPGINGSPKIPHKSSVRMLIISTSCQRSQNLYMLSLLSIYFVIVLIMCIIFICALVIILIVTLVTYRIILITLNNCIHSVCAC